MVQYGDENIGVDENKAKKLLDFVKNNEPQFTWKLVDTVSDKENSNEEFRDNILKPMLLKGVLKSNAYGKIVVHNENVLEDIIC